MGHPAFIQERQVFPLVLLDVVSDAGGHVIVPVGTTNEEKELVADLAEAREAAYLVRVASHLLRKELS